VAAADSCVSRRGDLLRACGALLESGPRKPCTELTLMAAAAACGCCVASSHAHCLPLSRHRRCAAPCAHALASFLFSVVELGGTSYRTFTGSRCLRRRSPRRPERGLELRAYAGTGHVHSLAALTPRVFLSGPARCDDSESGPPSHHSWHAVASPQGRQTACGQRPCTGFKGL